MNDLTADNRCPMPSDKSRIDVDALLESRRAGWSLEQPFYTDEEVFRADMERMFRRHWLCVGHVGRIPKSGDYFTFRIAGDSLIIIRGDDGRVYAHYNTCRHRGSRLCAAGSGHVRKLVCPYHQWVFDPNGALRSARHMPPDFDKSAFGLEQAHCQVAEGLIFICLGDETPDFSKFVRDATPQMKPHQLGLAKLAHTQSYEVAANWKLLLENSRECYHCCVGHPQYCHVHPGAAGGDNPELAEVARDKVAADPERLEALRRLGLDITPVPFANGSWYSCRRALFRRGFKTESSDGEPVAPMMGSLPSWDVGVLYVLTYPNLMLAINADYAALTAFVPISARVTRIDIDWMVHPEAIEGREYNVDRLTEFWRLTGEQDWKLCEDNQAGVNSSRYRPGPYAPTEKGVEVFIQWYVQRMRDAGTPAVVVT